MALLERARASDHVACSQNRRGVLGMEEKKWRLRQVFGRNGQENGDYCKIGEGNAIGAIGRGLGLGVSQE